MRWAEVGIVENIPDEWLPIPIDSAERGTYIEPIETKNALEGKTMYLNDWKESGIDGMKSDFDIPDEELTGVEVLLASYTYEDYYGSAFVIFLRDGKLFEVNGSHCSCFGLSESDYTSDATTQWQPEETTIEALSRRIETCGDFDGCREELRQVLAKLQ